MSGWVIIEASVVIALILILLFTLMSWAFRLDYKIRYWWRCRKLGGR
jgi:hypothetical protein